MSLAQQRTARCLRFAHGRRRDVVDVQTGETEWTNGASAFFS
jgi:hypothetical protein